VKGQPRSLAYLALGVVAINAMAALALMWVAGNRVISDLAAMGTEPCTPTRLALQLRPWASVATCVALTVAVLSHRRGGAMPILVVLNGLLLVLVVLCAYAWWWMPATLICGKLKQRAAKSP
jgi:hypothetical protein